MRRATGGTLCPPLDDTFIYLQYARRLAQGHPFEYSPGASPSTGASSILHVLALVPGWWAGLRGPAFVGLALVLGGVYLWAMLTLIPLAAARLAGPGRGGWAAATAMLLLALNGHLAWAAMTGMDTALWGAALSLLILLVAAHGTRPGPAWVVAGGLALARPEGLVLGAGALLFLMAADARSGRAAPRRARARAAGGALLLLAAPLLLNLALTGSPLWDSVRVKSLFSEPRPDVLGMGLATVPRAWRDIALLFVNDFQSGSWGPGSARVLLVMLAAGLGAGLALGVAGRRGAAGRLAAFLLLGGILLGGTTPVWQFHNYRYLIPYAAPAALLITIGLAAAARLLPRRVESPALWAATAALAILLLPGARDMWRMYGRNCGNIHDQQETVGRWIDAHTDPGTRVALNDAGAIAYYGNRPTLDLVGLTTHGWAVTSHQGSGALFERLESLPPASRPDLFAIYPRWYPALAATGFCGDVLMSADLKDNTICGDRLKRVYRIDWSLAGTGDEPVVRGALIHDFGLRIVDRVDVGDAGSEAAHRYGWFSTFRDCLKELPAGDSTGAMVEDGGRWISSGETMRIRCRPRQWMIMVMRTASEREETVAVTINGRPAGRLEIPRQPLIFAEPLLQVPDSLLTDSLATVDVRWVASPRGDGYNSFHYFFLQ